MSNKDNYIKGGGKGIRAPVPENGDAGLQVTPEQALNAVIALEALDWSSGLTRDEIRRRYHDLPVAIYLRLPDTKRFASSAEVLREVGIAQSRAEGDFLGANPDIPTEASLGDGGPPAWGQQPSVYSSDVSIDGGSAEDRDGLLPGDNPELGQEPAD